MYGRSLLGLRCHQVFTAFGGVELVVTKFRHSFLAFALLTTASCGGGGSSASTPPVSLTPAPTPTPTPVATAAAPTPPTATTAGYILTKTLAGADDLLAGFAIELGLKPAWGTGGIPGEYAADEGAFRFNCGGDGKLAKDDPIVFFNQPGVSHLHQVWGNSLFGASITPADLAKSAATNCNSTEYSLNRSSYWMPALIHENGDAIRPDQVGIYYKRKKASSVYCNPSRPEFAGNCVGIPSQIRFLFGWDSKKPTEKVQGAFWYCTTAPGHYSNIDDMFNAGCTAGADMLAVTVAPNCWDGKNLDTPDHRSHVAYTDIYPGTNKWACPSTHPYLIPQEENKAIYRVTADMIGTRSDGTKYSRVRVSSDAMLPGAKAGATLHADYMEAWVAEAKKMWTENCIDKGLSCSGGDLGNGKQLIGASEPTYGWRIPQPRVTL